MTLGGDFDYQSALRNFKNIDKLIKYVNAEVYIYILIKTFPETNNVFHQM